MDKSEIAKALGSLGGNKTVEVHGKDYMKEISRKGVEARKKNKLAKQAVDKQAAQPLGKKKNMPFEY